MTKKKILIIEDEEFVRELYEETLQRAGFSIVTAIDGNEGFSKVISEKPDLILLDIMLPKMNGLDMLKKIKKKETVKNIPVILLTNFSQESVIKEGFSLGAAGYLIKADYTLEKIVEEINKFIKKSAS